MPQCSIVPYLILLGFCLFFSEQIGQTPGNQTEPSLHISYMIIDIGPMHDDFTYIYSVNFASVHV